MKTIIIACAALFLAGCQTSGGVIPGLTGSVGFDEERYSVEAQASLDTTALACAALGLVGLDEKLSICDRPE